MIRIIMVGCNGKMGQVITGLAGEDTETKIVAGIDLSGEQKNDYPVYTTISECSIDADVAIDFSSPKGLDALLKAAVDKRMPLVLCTTGYTKEQQQKIEETAAQIPILRSANMSLGVNTLIKLIQTAAQVLAAANYDIEIIEKHHNQKVDAPSGTALALADCINAVLNEEYQYVYDRTGVRSPRNKKEIGISSVRGGTIVGEHEVIFAGTDEIIELKHTAYSKAIFGKGALEAAKFLAEQKPGYYQMKDVVK